MSSPATRLRQTIDILTAKRQAEHARMVQRQIDAALWCLDNADPPIVWARSVETDVLRPGPTLMQECGL